MTIWEGLVCAFKTTFFLLLLIPFFLFDACFHFIVGDYINWKRGGRSGIAGKLYDWWDYPSPNDSWE